MGLLKAGVGALSGVLADQWRDYFYSDSLDQEVLVRKGQKRVGGRSSNTKGSENIISDGSIIAVNDGQCMMVVENGAVVEFCAEPGEFIFDRSTEPSIFYGSFGESLKKSFNTFKKRFTFGADTAQDQRIYYFNTKEIIGNKYGTANPVPFRVVDKNVGLDIDIGIRCHGDYSYKLADPMLFYKNVSGNVESIFRRSEIDSQLKSELLTALQPAFAKISSMQIRYSELPGHTRELANVLNVELTGKWTELRGIQLVSIGVSSVTASEQDESMIKELQRNAAFRNPTMAAAHMVGSQAQAMQDAAKNEGNGAFMAFAGMNMAQNAGGANTQNLYEMGQPQEKSELRWRCSCGNEANTGNFCSECGASRPNAWNCSCGNANKGKFCSHCGKPNPPGELLYKCDKCGWEPENPKSPPKFCPECGDLFDDTDIIK